MKLIALSLDKFVLFRVKKGHSVKHSGATDEKGSKGGQQWVTL
jgi:hypothetical protein